MFTYLINFIVSSIIKTLYWKQYFYLSLFSFANLELENYVISLFISQVI